MDIYAATFLHYKDKVSFQISYTIVWSFNPIKKFNLGLLVTDNEIGYT